MRLRIFVITALLVGGFLYVTTKSDWAQHRLLDPNAGSGPLWSGPATTHATSLSSDENNNIDIYKAAHIATVNITSTARHRDKVCGCNDGTADTKAPIPAEIPTATFSR